MTDYAIMLSKHAKVAICYATGTKQRDKVLAHFEAQGYSPIAKRLPKP
jgi:hypothetical protein